MKVLIVESDAAHRKTLVGQVSDVLDHGEVFDVGSIAEALEWVAYDDPDILLFSHRPPDSDGVSFIRLFRNGPEHAEVPAVMICDEANAQQRKIGLEAGFTDLLTSPVDDVELVARIRTMMRLRARTLELITLHQQMTMLSTTDGLTGLVNRDYFMQLSDRELQRAKRYSGPLAVVMFDVDHFKTISSQWGQPVGDDVLRSIAFSCMKIFRQSDIPSRMGGEEFAVCLPETEKEQAAAVADRLRKTLETTTIRAGGHKVNFTISVGVAGLENQDRELDHVLQRAEAAMLDAKAAGRNRVHTG